MARKFTAQSTKTNEEGKKSYNVVIASSIEPYTLVETPIMNISSWKIYIMFVCYWRKKVLSPQLLALRQPFRSVGCV